MLNRIMAAKYRSGRATRARSALDGETQVRADYQAILRRVAQIPAGKVTTYSQIAWLAGLPGRARLVGRVLGSLPQLVAAIPDAAADSTSAGAAIGGHAQASAARSAGKAAVHSPTEVAAIPGETVADSMYPGPSVRGRAQASTASGAGNPVLACPWHRVINAQGRLSLPINSASYLEQRRRLREEGVLFRGERIDLRRYRWRSLDESPLLD